MCHRCQSLCPAGSRSFRTSTALWKARSLTTQEGERKLLAVLLESHLHTSGSTCLEAIVFLFLFVCFVFFWKTVGFCFITGACTSLVCQELERQRQFMRWFAVCSTQLTWTKSLHSTSSRSMGWKWQTHTRPTSKSYRWEWSFLTAAAGFSQVIISSSGFSVLAKDTLTHGLSADLPY